MTSVWHRMVDTEENTREATNQFPTDPSYMWQSKWKTNIQRWNRKKNPKRKKNWIQLETTHYRYNIYIFII